MEDNKFMVGAPKMNAMTYGSMDTMQNIPATSERKQQVQEYDYDIPSNLADIYTRSISRNDDSDSTKSKNDSNRSWGTPFAPNPFIAIKELMIYTIVRQGSLLQKSSRNKYQILRR